MKSTGQRPVVLIIRDGWGESLASEPGYDPGADAIHQARTPVDEQMRKTAPSCLLNCSGTAVGLPEGQMGNSEVGHLNLGAGRIVYQDITRIHLAIEDGSFFANPAFSTLAESIAAGNGLVHLIGLCSDGGVHSHISHLKALIDLFTKRNIRVAVHCITDGRDTSPTSGAGFVKEVADHLAASGNGFIATVVGRYFAMDRDKRWDRTRDAYAAIVRREGEKIADPVAALHAAYAAGTTDEFVTPLVIEAGAAYQGLRPEDGIIFYNFRADRTRQLTNALVGKDFEPFATTPHSAAQFVAMTQYEDHVEYPVAFPPQDLSNVLADALASAGLRQLRAAETEKYAHVTYFFNGGKEEPKQGEDRCLVASPKVATYDLKPEMSALELTDEVIRRCQDNEYDFVLINYANIDMVGHSANMKATIEAVEVVDKCVGRLIDFFRAADGVLLITSDHGNAEKLRDGNGQPFTAHTTNPVRMHMVGEKHGRDLRNGILADIAPTVLDILGADQPREMTGSSLLADSAATEPRVADSRGFGA